jgi:NADH-quinone oxidoreductase subunit N
MIVGAFFALVESRIKRFIAYSSINQIGFLLIGLILNTEQGILASLIFLTLYIFTNLGFFILFLNTHDEKITHPLIYLTDLKNFAKYNRGLTIPLVIILFSMAGIPPLAGFFGKLYLLLNAFEEKLYFLVFVGLLTSIISAYYYLKLVKLM